MTKDNETLEAVAKILIKVNREKISDKKAIEEIYNIVLENSTDKLRRFLEDSS